MDMENLTDSFKLPFNDSFDFSLMGHDEERSPPAFSRPTQIFLIVLYSITALLALAGNVTAIWVLMVGKRSSKDLRTFLVNLSLSDVTMALFSIPFTYTHYMLQEWIFHPLFCPFVQFMTCYSAFVSVYTLVAIGIDRYFAVMNPFKTRWTKSRSKIIVIWIWIAGFLVSCNLLKFAEAVPTDTFADTTIYECQETWRSTIQNGHRIYSVVIFTIIFGLPVCVLIFVYLSIGWKMLHHSAPGNAEAGRDAVQLESRIKVVKMLSVVVALFILCWLPLQLFRLLYDFDYKFEYTETGRILQDSLFFICHWLAMANSFLNPIIYCFMSDNFRADLRHILRSCCPSWKSRFLKSNRTESSCCDSSFRTTMILLKHGGHPNQHQNLGENGQTRVSPTNSTSTMVITSLILTDGVE